MPPSEPSEPRLALHTTWTSWLWSRWTALAIGLARALRPSAQRIRANELPTNSTERPLVVTLTAMLGLIVLSMMAYGLHHLLFTLNRLLGHQIDQRQQRAIRDYIDRRNENPNPFVWHKSADATLACVGPAANKIN